MQDNLDLDRLTTLSIKYISGIITSEEEKELNAFLDKPGIRDRFYDIVSKEQFANELPHWEEAAAREERSAAAIGTGIRSYRRPAAVVSIRRWGLVAAVAGGAVLCYFGYRTVIEKRHMTEIAREKPLELMPGGQKATLVLANGQKILLDEAKKGQLAVEQDAKIEKVSNGVLSYSRYLDEKTQPPAASKDVSYNTLTVPAGGTYEVILPDRSRVYLNSGSSLRYATTFDPLKSRTVELTGEGYFDIRPDASRPFEVKVNDKTIAVLGTRFDVNAYDNEPSLDATLLDGAIRVSDARQALLLRPGQQVQVKTDGLHLVRSVDTMAVVAWKMGDFRFNNAPIKEVMRQLERWYNVRVQFAAGQDSADADGYTGAISRNLPASEVLNALQASGYHFKIVAKDRIEVSP